MKILSLSPYYNNNTKISYNNNYQHNLGFQARPKKLQINADQFVSELINNKNSELGQEIKELMSKPLSRNVFTTTLVSLAAVVTKLILGEGTNNDVHEGIGENKADKSKNKEKVKQTKKTKEKKSEDKKYEKKEADTQNISTEKTQERKKRNTLKISEEELVEKLQAMASKGFTLKQMGESLGGLTESSICKYLKKYNIKKTKKSEKPADTTSKKENINAKEERFNLYISENANCTNILDKLKNHKELENGYKELIYNHIKNPKDEQIKQSLAGLEKLFKHIGDLPSRFRKAILETFSEHYSSNLSDIGYIFGNIQPCSTIQEYLTDFQKGLPTEDINNWAKTPAFSYEEYKMTEAMPADTINAIHELKKQGKFKFELQKDDEWKNYKFYLNFVKGTELTEKLKMISNFHEAIYGNIYIHKDSGTKVERDVNIKEELLNLINKDKNMDSIYNILNFLEPSKIQSLQIDKNELFDYSGLNQNLKIKFEKIINSLDSKNPRLQELEEIINDNYLFDNLMTNNHAKIRFVSRFVLNQEVQDGDLYNKCSDAVECLANDLEEKFKDKYIIFPFKFSESSAPCFYLPKSKLGDFIRVTLNNHGQIHTIFEDTKLKSRR